MEDPVEKGTMVRLNSKLFRKTNTIDRRHIGAIGYITDIHESLHGKWTYVKLKNSWHILPLYLDELEDVSPDKENEAPTT